MSPAAVGYALWVRLSPSTAMQPHVCLRAVLGSISPFRCSIPARSHLVKPISTERAGGFVLPLPIPPKQAEAPSGARFPSAGRPQDTGSHRLAAGAEGGAAQHRSAQSPVTAPGAEHGAKPRTCSALGVGASTPHLLGEKSRKRRQEKQHGSRQSELAGAGAKVSGKTLHI